MSSCCLFCIQPVEIFQDLLWIDHWIEINLEENVNEKSINENHSSDEEEEEEEEEDRNNYPSQQVNPSIKIIQNQPKLITNSSHSINHF